MTFRVGQKVVCVDASPYARGWPNPWAIGEELHLDRVYTITGIKIDGGRLLLRFHEITRPHRWGYGAFRFRPIVERKTDITVFTEILRKATKPVRTPAISLHNRA